MHAISAVFIFGKIPAKSPFRGTPRPRPRSVSTECRQRMQRLLKTLHRDDPQTPRILARFGCVLPSRDEKHIHSCGTRTERLLLDAADRPNTAVEVELAGRRHLQP